MFDLSLKSFKNIDDVYDDIVDSVSDAVVFVEGLPNGLSSLSDTDE